MTRVTLDDDLRQRLHDLSHPLELRDESGRLVARVLPVIDPAQYEGLEPEIDQDEIRRRRQHKGTTYTTAEGLANLGSR